MGPKNSGAAAEALRTWLPKIINAVKPWLSSADIDKGARWSTDIAVRLESSKAGIICLTPSNLQSEWILFEAGALSKTIANTFVCPFLIGLEPTQVKGPLAQFQATKAVREDVLRLLKTLNSGLDETALTEAHIEEAFEVWWPKLDSQLKTLPQDGGSTPSHRTDRDVLEEILSFVRNQNRASIPVLSEDDRKQVFAARALKAIRALHGVVGISYSGPVLKGSDLEITVTPNKVGERLGKYRIVVPAIASPDDMEVLALTQIKEIDQSNMPTQPESSTKEIVS